MSEKLSRAFEFAFVGVASITVQMVFMRQLVGLFGGSEVLYALILTIWLVQTGIWSWLGDRVSVGSAGGRLVLLYLCLAISSLWYLGVPYAKNLVLQSYGPVPISRAGLFSFVALVIPTAFPGMAFATIFHKRKGGDRSATVSGSYVSDSVGFAVGGLALTLLFVLGGLDRQLLLILSAASLTRIVSMKLRLSPAPLLILFLILGSIPLYQLSKITARFFQNRSEGVICSDTYFSPESREESGRTRDALSPYGYVQFVADSLTMGIFYNSHRVSTLPNPPVEEDIALGLAMCAHRGSACVVGNSCDGKAVFASRDSNLSVVQLEPDPAVCYLFTHELANLVMDTDAYERVVLEHSDPITYLQNCTRKFDLIHINYTNALSISTGVSFTREFFNLVRARLNDGGVLSLSTPCGENFIRPERLEYIKSLYQTLSNVFPKVEILPGETATLVAGMANASITSDAFEILASLGSHREHLQYVSEAHLPDRLSEFRKEKLHDLLDEVEGDVLTVEKPEAFLMNTLLEMDKFSGIDSKILGWFERLPGALVVAIAVLPMLLVLASAFVQSKRANLLVPALFAGWWGISAEILLLVLYQSISGNLFSRLGLLIGMFMLGLALGAWAGSRFFRRSPDSLRILSWVLYAACLLGLISGFATPALVSDLGAYSLIEPLLYVCAAVFGLIPGAIFNMSVDKHSRLHDREAPGRFYAADLIGAAVGGSLTSILVLPLLGIRVGFLLLSFLGFSVAVYTQIRK